MKQLSITIVALLFALTGCSATDDTGTGSDCVGGKCDSAGDTGQAEEQNPVQRHVYVGLVDSCRTIAYTASTNTLEVSRDMPNGEAAYFSAPLEWSHPQATAEYVGNTAFLDALAGGAGCEAGTDLDNGDMFIRVEVGDRTEAHYFASCASGEIANVIRHINTLADDYFADAACD